MQMVNVTIAPEVENIISVYRAARPEQIAAGLAWYPEAHDLAVLLAGGDLAKGAGVIAALSPQTSWSQNVKLATRAFTDGKASGQTGANVSKANRIMAGESPEDVLGWNDPKAKSGHKVRNFFRNIVNPVGPECTIDRHAHDIAVGRQTDNMTRGQLGRVGVYDLFADCYREAARRLGVPVAVLQAVTWVVWREAIGLDLD